MYETLGLICIIVASLLVGGVIGAVILWALIIGSLMDAFNR